MYYIVEIYTQYTTHTINIHIYTHTYVYLGTYIKQRFREALKRHGFLVTLLNTGISAQTLYFTWLRTSWRDFFFFLSCVWRSEYVCVIYLIQYLYLRIVQFNNGLSTGFFWVECGVLKLLYRVRILRTDGIEDLLMVCLATSLVYANICVTLTMPLVNPYCVIENFSENTVRTVRIRLKMSS